jgi:phenylglyoxylate dehydrogenase epsilon subunit
LKKKKHVIIGSGTAALSALKQLRKTGCDDDVTLLTMEKYPPYSPMSLPYIVSGRVNESDIRMVPDGFFDRMNATLIREQKVVGISPRERQVLYKNGTSDYYDRLLIATGSDPIVPSLLQEAGGRGFHVMDDCLALIQQLKKKRNFTILGAGLVAMELAAALKEKGKEVTVIAPRERILRAYFDIEASSRIIELFAEAGVAVHVNWGEATAAERDGNGIKISFSRDKTIETEILLVCLGVQPRVSFLAGSGIDVGRGVVVDRQMRANIPHIFAAGDVAEAADFFTGQNGFNPILPNAVSQGKVAGSAMADQPAEYEGWLPMNTFNFFGHLATSIGKTVPSEGDEVLIENDTSNGYYRKIIYSEGRLLGAAFLDTDVDAGVIQYLIRKRTEIGNYKEMLVRLPREVSLWLMNEAEKRATLSMEE